MFLDFLFHLRAQGLPVGTGQWLLFLDAARKGIVTGPEDLYRIGRALLCRSEAEFDGYDLAFAATFDGAELPEDLRRKLEEWLARAADERGGEWVDPGIADDELWEELRKRLAEQKERHDGGGYWVGTRGTSPFGHSGRATRGIRVGGSGGGRSAVQVALDRQWEGYRTDRTLETRDLQVALRTLRKLVREGDWELDLDETIDKTCENAGEIELVERRARDNQVRLVLLMDAGGSMAPHAERVEELFTAASEMKTFRSFDAYFFHNCVYRWLWRDYATNDKLPTHEVLAELTHRHRVVFVGDASMAPYELFSPVGWGEQQPAGLEWLKRFRERCPASVWLNPDNPRFWNHPTVSAIGRLFPMYELTVDGLKEAVRKLRAPV